jgi:hypothetical protein
VRCDTKIDCPPVEGKTVEAAALVPPTFINSVNSPTCNTLPSTGLFAAFATCAFPLLSACSELPFHASPTQLPVLALIVQVDYGGMHIDQ